MELLIKNAQVIDWSQNFIGDIYIKNGIISEIGVNLDKNCKVLDAKNLIVMPAFVDLHVHFRDPGFTYKEDVESGSRAAVKGGFTLVNLMANTKPVCSNMDVVNYVKEKAKKIGLIDVHQTVSITKNFNGVDIDHLDLLDNTVKVISEDGKDVMDGKIMFEAMKKAKEKNMIVMCHCEEHNFSKEDMRLAENLMTLRNLELAKFTGCKIHIAHVSTKEAMEYIIRAKKEGVNATCEVAPHHLVINDEIKYRVNPPLRKDNDIKFLIKAVEDGYVDVIATDHAPHSGEDKKNGAPGISGIEVAFPLCYTTLVKDGKLTLNQLSKIMSKNPSDILGIKKGTIKIGYDGDLVLIDLEKKFEINKEKFASKGKNTPFNGKEVYGEIVKTIKGGKVVYSK